MDADALGKQGKFEISVPSDRSLKSILANERGILAGLPGERPFPAVEQFDYERSFGTEAVLVEAKGLGF